MKKFFAVVSLLGILSCSKSGDDNDPGGNPNPNPGPGGGNTELTITTITPNSAEKVPVTITGTGFHATAAQNQVQIGGLAATVTKATATSLEITLPDNLGLGDHDVKVTANGKSATKVNGFHLVGWIVSNFVGSGAAGQNDGTGNDASFQQPVGLVTDAAGNFYVSDLHKIRKITPQGEVSTFAGDGRMGNDDGTRANARFNTPASIAIDNAGNLYVADRFNHMIRKITPAQEVTTIAGTGTLGHVDGAGNIAQFSLPYGVAVNPAGTHLYVGDQENDVIRVIDLATNIVSTIAGNGTSTRKDDRGLLAGIPSPGNIKFDADGNLFITERGAGKIRKMDINGNVTTLGGFEATQLAGPQPTHIALDREKNLYVTFSGLDEIKKYDVAKNSFSLFAGASTGPDLEDGAVSLIHFKRPEGIVLKEDGQGNKTFFVVDTERKKIKKIVKQ